MLHKDIKTWQGHDEAKEIFCLGGKHGQVSNIISGQGDQSELVEEIAKRWLDWPLIEMQLFYDWLAPIIFRRGRCIAAALQGL